jgi:hypothetical protein
VDYFVLRNFILFASVIVSSVMIWRLVFSTFMKFVVLFLVRLEFADYFV